MNIRDNFSLETKRLLGSRVAFHCCYPGCSIITIGPNTTEDKKVVILGEAAHIHAAAPGGPRYLPSMTSEERKSFENGIWLCRQHAKLIDANYGNYSAATLQQWKKVTEAEAYRQLKELGKIKVPDPTTIICLNPSLMFEGIWKAANKNSWTFIVKDFIYGDINSLRDYGIKTDEPFNNYIIVESQGDGRLLSQHFEWQRNDDGLEICVDVYPSVIRRDPNFIGTDFATGLDGDIIIENGDFKKVSGKELAKQLIERNLSIALGSWRAHPTAGSLFTIYYNEHKNNRTLLNRLIKIEITRLITIPVNPSDPTDQPELSFINRIHEVIVMEELDNIVPVYISLEWGDKSIWSDTVHVHLHVNDPEEEVNFQDFPDFIKEMFDEEPLEQMKRLTAKFNQEEMQEKVNPTAIMKIFTISLPAIMEKAEDALNAEVYPLFDSHIIYRSINNDSFNYYTSYDLELGLMKYSIQQIGVTIKLNGFKKAGSKAFDVTSDVFIYFNDYNYAIGASKAEPWLIKMYHQLPTSDEIIRLANQLINSVIRKINQKIIDTERSARRI